MYFVAQEYGEVVGTLVMFEEDAPPSHEYPFQYFYFDQITPMIDRLVHGRLFRDVGEFFVQVWVVGEHHQVYFHTRTRLPVVLTYLQRALEDEYERFKDKYKDLEEFLYKLAMDGGIRVEIHEGKDRLAFPDSWPWLKLALLRRQVAQVRREHKRHLFGKF